MSLANIISGNLSKTINWKIIFVAKILYNSHLLTMTLWICLMPLKRLIDF